MNLNIELSEANRLALGLGAAEEVRYCSPFDIDETGRLCTNSYVCVTTRRVIVLSEGVIQKEIPLNTIETMRCEAQVNNGLLIYTTKEQSAEILLARFSMRHVSRMSWIARGAILLRDGSPRTQIGRASCRERV